jgi:DUF971 family protein
MTQIWPVEIRLTQDKATLKVCFEGGETYDISAELLRVSSPSAELQGHSEAQRKTIGGKRNVSIIKVEPVGNYAVRLTFDDMHSTGIYTWAFLHKLGAGQTQAMAVYESELAVKGLNRDVFGLK